MSLRVKTKAPARLNISNNSKKIRWVQRGSCQPLPCPATFRTPNHTLTPTSPPANTNPTKNYTKVFQSRIPPFSLSSHLHTAIQTFSTSHALLLSSSLIINIPQRIEIHTPVTISLLPSPSRPSGLSLDFNKRAVDKTTTKLGLEA